ncbi:MULTISPECIES: arginyltransferase [unclassified Corallococcus]|uniref:arginyltransferase n=1 Tax=unclassified Corallococcus TaxID=2685029 RepID=UPI001A8D93D4|nr:MULTISPECIES: arginyltransferase [unclassified Corallococcus]MBN9683700.1 arginyltransferase [Corallococcus sp. NCSPR001]WAS84792.1 arginyltransferase [Corallococcus sp. NCRR]
MAVLLAHEIEEPRPCSYLPGREASLETLLMRNVTAQEYEHLLVRGWRRFGPQYFRPACASCHECVSLRVPVEGFTPNRSQRRARAACAHLRVEVGPPRVDEERLALYRAWHADREASRDWEASELGAREYSLQFAFPHPSAREVAWYDDSDPTGPKLVGLGLCDETPRVWSAVYFFYDPAYARLSLGKASVLFQVELARERGIPHVYLGYRVLACDSLRYKAGFRPHELLEGRPALDAPPEWRAAVDAPEAAADAQAPEWVGPDAGVRSR